MQLHRLAFLFGASTLLLLGTYACGGDDDSSTPDADAGADTGTSTPDTGSGETPDTGSSVTDAGDGGNGLDGAVPAECTGNPLLLDGGTGTAIADGGANQVGALFTVIANAGFGYGPQYVDELGGRIAFSSVQAAHDLQAAEPDGGGLNANELLTVADALNITGSDYYNGNIYTMTAVQTTGGGSLYRVPLDGGTAEVAVTFPATAMVSPNNLVITKNGTIYLTDPAFQATPTGALTTAVRKVNIDGGSLSVVAGDDLPVGIALNKDQTKLYVSYNSPVALVKVWTLDAVTGAITGAPTSFNTNATYPPAGIAVDQGGNVWVTGQGAGNNGVVEVYPASGGTAIARVFVTTAKPNGIAFGGADRKKVFITTETDGPNAPVLSLQTRCPGVQ